ncbi:uncharacterized protein LOC123504957 [Portunus trituberculatus]|uniref:Uncharacterized protein n=1 Tax=Portunus trituberculatus TaxID=210409 RepID=A0A5B7DKY4_PORTR|nr:uncharacterized protein LOC123504957 [Portunus trituberculatus]MPC21606.1 hypothetical protein [Portunus trituberculatus]
MKLTILTCWGVVAALVVAAQGKPFRSPAFDIARAYENYHNLWMSEARRNSVAPMSFGQQVARTWPQNKAAVARLAQSAPVAEKPPQEQAKAGTQAEKGKAGQNVQQSATTEQQTTEMTTEMATEMPTTEQTIQEEMTTEMQMQKQTAQANVETKAAKKPEPSQPRRQPTTPTSRPATMRSAFDTFFNRWNAERIRNSIPPVATPIPPLSSFYKQTLFANEPVTTKSVDRPAKATEATVDTLTQASASEVSATASAPSTDPVKLIKSLAQSDSWRQQGNAPIIILLQ